MSPKTAHGTERRDELTKVRQEFEEYVQKINQVLDSLRDHVDKDLDVKLAAEGLTREDLDAWERSIKKGISDTLARINELLDEALDVKLEAEGLTREDLEVTGLKIRFPDVFLFVI